MDTFEIEISQPSNGEFPVVMTTASGEKYTSILVLPKRDTLFNRLLEKINNRQRDTLFSENEVTRIGKRLYSLLFHGKALDLINRAEEQAEGRGLRIKFVINNHKSLLKIANLPWELLIDDFEIPLVTKHSLVRSLKDIKYINPPFVNSSLKMLIVWSLPVDLEKNHPLKIDEEVLAIKKCVQSLVDAGQLVVEVLAHAQPETLQNAIKMVQPHMLHFVGHGYYVQGASPKLILETPERSIHLMSARHLSTALRDSPLRLAVLNACYSGSQGQSLFTAFGPALLANRIPAVIGMQASVLDIAGKTFVSALYDTLVQTKSVDNALVQGRNAILVEGKSEIDWGLATLYMQSVDGVLFQSTLLSDHTLSQLPLYLPKPPQHLVERKEEFQQALTLLDVHHTLAIRGIVGIGKKTMGIHLALTLCDSRSIFWYDFSGGDTSMGNSFLESLALFLSIHGYRQLLDQINKKSDDAKPGTRNRIFAAYAAEAICSIKSVICLANIDHNDIFVDILLGNLGRNIKDSKSYLLTINTYSLDMKYGYPSLLLKEVSEQDIRDYLSYSGINISNDLIRRFHTATHGNIQLISLVVDAMTQDDNWGQMLDDVTAVNRVGNFILGNFDKNLQKEERFVLEALSLLRVPSTHDSIEAIVDQEIEIEVLDDLTDRGIVIIYDTIKERHYGLPDYIKKFYHKRIKGRKSRDMNQRAGEYFENVVYDSVRAGRHYLQAGMPNRAIQILTSDVASAINHGRGYELQKLLSEVIPEDIPVELWCKVLGNLGRIAMDFGNTQEAADLFNKTLILLEARPDIPNSTEQKVYFCGYLATALRYSNLNMALEKIDEALLLSNTQSDLQKGILYFRRGDILAYKLEYEEAIPDLEYSLNLLPANATGWRAQAMTSLGIAKCGVGQVEDGIRNYEKSNALCEHTGNLWVTMDNYHNLGYERDLQGKWTEALDNYTKELHLAEQLDRKESQVTAHLGIGILKMNQGQGESAKMHLQNAIELSENLNRPDLLLATYSSMADLANRQQWWELSADAIEKTFDLLSKAQNRGQESEVYRNRSIFSIFSGDIKQALSDALYALRVARELQDDREKGISLRVIAVISHYVCKKSIALRMFARSVALLSEAEPYERARTECAWGKALIEQGHKQTGLLHIRTAHAIFTELGARQDLRESKILLDN